MYQVTVSKHGHIKLRRIENAKKQSTKELEDLQAAGASETEHVVEEDVMEDHEEKYLGDKATKNTSPNALHHVVSKIVPHINKTQGRTIARENPDEKWKSTAAEVAELKTVFVHPTSTHRLVSRCASQSNLDSQSPSAAVLARQVPRVQLSACTHN